uniref:Uncharacterized protein n=1 Tax=Panagrolaimus davidi TaxID=227884 RepID=A0A914NYV3_9BILA
MGNILKLQNLKNLESLSLQHFPESLNIQDLSAFLKKYKNVEIEFFFDVNISDGYKNRLDALIDEIIESEVLGRRIRYNDQDEKKLKIMNSRRKSNVEQYDNDV